MPTPIRQHTDLSYRSKVCLTCRATILRRPTRVFLLDAILQPLGIAQVRATTSSLKGDDPWALSFPPDPVRYRLYDESDEVYRCPECCFELLYGQCPHCEIEFSEPDNDDEWLSQDGSGSGSEIDEDESETGSATILDVLRNPATVDQNALERRRDRIMNHIDLFNYAARYEDQIQVVDDFDSLDEAQMRPAIHSRSGSETQRGIPPLMELLAAESDGDGSVGESEEQVRPRSRRSQRTPSSGAPENRRRSARVQVQVESDDEDESYESSFIDDGEENLSSGEEEDEDDASNMEIDELESEVGPEEAVHRSPTPPTRAARQE